MTEPKQTYVPELAALDRCEHGRHRQDPCVSCPDGWSTGNLFLEPGTRIGTNLYGEPIVAPEHDRRGYSENWVPKEHHRVK